MQYSAILDEDAILADPKLTREELETALADAELLQSLSTSLIQGDSVVDLYKKIVDAGVAIMRSQFGTMQMLYPDGGTIGKLRLLASKGFTPEAEKYWEWVYENSYTSCGEVLRTGKRVVIPDYANCDFMQGAPTLPIFLEGGVYAAQSTPLYSRSGKLLGMISTHWNYVYRPPKRHLRLLDILARQAADLIERAHSIEALRNSEERMRALTMSTNDLVYRMSPDWRVMYQLDGRTFLGNTTEPLSDWQQKYIYPDDQAIVSAAIEEAIRSQKVFHLEHRVLKADGGIGWVSSKAVPIKDTNGNVIEWFGAASDVTEKRSFVIELENRVEERTQALQRSNADLQQFAHVASHDLQEPVRKIHTFGFRLQDELNAHGSERSKNYIDKILASAARMSTMIKGILTYSTLNRVEEKFSCIDLRHLISEIEDDLEIVIQQKQAKIECSGLPMIEGIPVLIYQLFYNLINNSLKFSKDAERPIISVTGRISGHQAIIEIKDNGIGFEPEYNQSIFESFTRLNPKSKFDGTGLGLALSRKVVERHRGSIEAFGQRDVGATFSIVLPLKQFA